MALTRIPRLSLMNARLLYDTMGSATAVFEHRKDIRDVIPEANEKLVEVLRDVDEAIADAVVDAINLSGQQHQQKQKQTALNIFFHLIIYIMSLYLKLLTKLPSLGEGAGVGLLLTT
jgi:hypothetical protein